MEQDAGLALLALKQQISANHVQSNNIVDVPDFEKSIRILSVDGGVSVTSFSSNNGFLVPSPPPGALARIDTDDVVYFVCKHKIVIGRESGHNPADVSLKENSFVSRAHLELFYNNNESTGVVGSWYFNCNGKNGIFVDDVLHRRGQSTSPLPSEYEIV